MDHGEYCGPLEALRGKTALVRPDATYELLLEQRTLLAQFDDTGATHPETGANLAWDWHTFPAAHFKLLVTVGV